MQGTLPMYLAEIAPLQLRGLFTQAYTFWFVIGQLLSSVPLQVYNQNDPTNFRDPIRIQFLLIGILIVIYVFLPESPWWQVQKGKIEPARASLRRIHGQHSVFNVDEELEIMYNTVEEERKHGKRSSLGFGILKGINGWRLLIACWPKVTQQFVGLSVFNSYATYVSPLRRPGSPQFFQTAGFADPFLITVILSCVQIISMIITMFLVDIWGRRPLVVYGYFLTVLADLGMGATGLYPISSGSPAAGLLVFFACIATLSTTSASAVGYAYLAEIPKQDYRAQSAGWGLAFSNLFSILVGLTGLFGLMTVLLHHAVDANRGEFDVGRQNGLLLRLHRFRLRGCRVVHHPRSHPAHARRDRRDVR